MKDGASKAAGSLKAHIQGRNCAKARKKVQQEKNTEQSEVQAQKKQAKDAAEQIKQQEKVLSSIFHIDCPPALWRAPNHCSHTILRKGDKSEGCSAPQPALTRNGRCSRKSEVCNSLWPALRMLSCADSPSWQRLAFRAAFRCQESGWHPQDLLLPERH